MLGQIWWRAAFVVLVSFLMVGVTAVDSCPPADTIKPCVCTSRADETQISCGHSDLSGILAGLSVIGTQLTKPVDELILENNQIPSLPGKAFSPLRVVRVMLRDNKLERIAANWLAGQEDSLLEVFIVEPELKSLPVDSFEILPNLEALTVRAGLVSRLPNFSRLSRLRYVHLEMPSLAELTPGRLHDLEALETLKMINSPGVRALEASALQDLPRLVSVNFTGCGISRIHPRALFRLPSLKELTFSYNSLVDPGEVGRSIRELPHLAIVRLDRNQIIDIPETSFVDIPPLEELYLNDNEIVEVKRGAFHRLPSLVKLDLSNNFIRRIMPDFYLQSFDSRLEELHLMNNQLDHVMALTIVLDSFPTLKFVDISSNSITDIMFGALRGHPTLERLHINNNQLRRVVREAFMGFPALRELRLRNNSLSNYLGMPLWNLPVLKGLDLSYNEFRRLDRRVLANLPSLRRLDVSKNNLLVVDPASFLGTPTLEHVNLSHNALESISPQAFPHLTNLFEIDVSSNRLRTIVPGLPRAVEYLHLANNQLSSFPRAPSPDLLLPALRLLDMNGNNLHKLHPEAFISMPLLKKLYIGHNAMQKIDERAFDGLGRLERLDLHENKITAIQENAFRDLRRLQELSLRNNRLETVQSNLLKENAALKRLDLSKNQLTGMSTKALEHTRELRELSLAGNSFTLFPDAAMNLPHLENLDLSGNRIHQLVKPLSTMKSLVSLNLSKNKIRTLLDGTFSHMQNLTVLDLEGNEIQYLTPHVVKSMPALYKLRMCRNKLSTVPSAAFSDLPQLTEVELQENQLTHLASDSFTGVPNLLMMNLSYNLITGLDHAGLQGLKSMEILDISHNRIAKLSTPDMPNLDALIQLKMDSNKICVIQGSPFSKMSHLRILSMKNNKLVAMSDNAFQPLRSTIYQLDIEGNPLKCACALLGIQRWIKESPYAGPRCSDGSSLKDYRLLKQECSDVKNIDSSCEDFHLGSLNQQLSSNAWKDPNQKPLPHESDYFYEDYIEYDDNISLPTSGSTTARTPLTSNTLSSNTGPKHQAIVTAAQSTKGPPSSNLMSHFVSGDTPTIYAKPGMSSAVGVVSHKPTKGPASSVGGAGSAGQPQLTFFGMPLPSLNIGSFWGSSRNAEGGSRFQVTKGRVQQVTLPPKMDGGGFKPMVPSRGGFRPVTNPFGDRTTPSTSPPHRGPLVKFEPIITQKSGSSAGVSSEKPFWDVTTSRTSLNTVPIDQLAQLSGVSSTTRAPPPPVVVTSPGQSSSPSSSSLFEFNRLEPDFSDLSTTTTTESSLESFVVPTANLVQSSHHRHEYSNSRLLFNDTVVEVESSENDRVEPSTIEPSTTSPYNIGFNGGPSPLSGFLAPGGQLPPKTPGRPIITKVPSPSSATDLPIAQPLPSHETEESSALSAGLGAERSPPAEREQRHFHPKQAMAWYYKNYNNTEVKPFVGRAVYRGSLSSDSTPSQGLQNQFNYLYTFTMVLVTCLYGLNVL